MSQSVQAQRAENFVQSIAVNTHIGWTGTPYANIPIVQQELAFLGVDHIRDQQPYPSTLPSYQTLANAGVQFDLFFGGPGDDFGTALPRLLPNIDALEQSNPGSIFSLEGPNELNGGQPVYYNGASSDGGGAVADQIMQAIRAAVSGDNNIRNIPVLNASIGGSPDWYSYAQQEGNMSAYVDGANYHVYPTGGQQSGSTGSFSFAAQMAWMTAPGKPLTFTETGYSTAYGVSGSNDVDAATQAKNTLNALADAYKLGVQQTYLYDLMDGVANPAPGDDFDSYGLFTSDGTPKLAATAIHNLTTILSDKGTGAATFNTDPLNFTLSGLPGSTGNSLLLEKSSGAFDLMLWNEAPDWDPTAQREIAVSPVSTTVNLGKVYGTVEVFDPLSGSTPVQTLTNVSQVTVALTDHPLIVEVEPGATIPAPVVTTQGSGPDTIDLAVSENAYKGDAQFTVSVDGNAIGGSYTVHMPKGSGDDHLLLKGSWGAGSHTVQVAFINDAYGGSPTADRNFYLDGITFDGHAQRHTVAAFAGNGSGNFTVTGPTSIPVGTGPDTLTLHMSEDAYKGNAMFNVAIDGHNVATGDVVTALHAAGAVGDFQFTGIGSGQHGVDVTFTNDAYAGSPSTDRNLYVNSLDFGANHYGGAALFGNGTKHFTVSG